MGELRKTEVRRIAEEIGLPNAKKKDSTGICFIGERPFREFLNRYISKEPGPIKDERGRTIGKHQGLSFYTLGQRQGLGIGGVKEKGAQRGGGEHAPWFVARKDMEKNTLWVVQGHDHPWLLSARAGGGRRELGRRRAAARRAPMPPRRATGRPMRLARCRRANGGLPPRLRRAAMGGDARPVRRAVRRRGLPGRRRDQRPNDVPLSCRA